MNYWLNVIIFLYQSVQKGAKEQLDSVEKHIKIQELGVGQMKTDYNRELQRLKQLIKQKEDVIGKLQREKYATQDNLELVWRAATSDDKKVKDALKNTKIYNIWIPGSWTMSGMNFPFLITRIESVKITHKSIKNRNISNFDFGWPNPFLGLRKFYTNLVTF